MPTYNRLFTFEPHDRCFICYRAHVKGFCNRNKNARTNSLQLRFLCKRNQCLSTVILALILLFNISFLHAVFDMVAYRLRMHYAEEKNKLV